MAKIAFDKYYTPPTVAKWCINKTYEIIGKENITEVVEPSAGCGMFSHQIEGCKAYDLYPQHEYIEQADFLKLDLGGYKKGRLFIGNPPFGGSSGKLIKEFYNKCVNDGDYIAFILPSSYYWNYKNLYKFEIVYSCMIETPYTNHNLKTSFTIYKRNDTKKDWREEKIKLNDVTMKKYSRGRDDNKKIGDYDLCLTMWGKILQPTEPYKHASFITVKINNENLRDKIIKFFDWVKRYNEKTKFLEVRSISAAQTNIQELSKLMKICIPEIN